MTEMQLFRTAAVGGAATQPEQRTSLLTAPTLIKVINELKHSAVLTVSPDYWIDNTEYYYLLATVNYPASTYCYICCIQMSLKGLYITLLGKNHKVIVGQCKNVKRHLHQY